MTEHKRILIVDNDSIITEFVTRSLAAEGYEAISTSSAEKALMLEQFERFDLFIFDVTLPDMNGYELCKRIRAVSTAPILFLSARNSEQEKVLGLEMGANDYLTKPFDIRELVARVRALLRRANSIKKSNANGTISAGGITLDEKSRSAGGDKGEVHLTPLEFELLACLMRNCGKVLSYETLLREVWEWESFSDKRVVVTHIMHLRNKLKAAGYDQLIETVRSCGYRIRR